MRIYEVDYFDGEDFVGAQLYSTLMKAESAVRYADNRAEILQWASIGDFIKNSHSEGDADNYWSDGEILDLLCNIDGE